MDSEAYVHFNKDIQTNNSLIGEWESRILETS